ncbi:MAG TPA: hypothetical protein V6C71_15405 [Coleofasciculaceae cyanobacterium]|jgi:uncharacterized Tic20 family protein
MTFFIFAAIGLLILALYADKNTSFFIQKDKAEKDLINFLIVSLSGFLFIALLASLSKSLLVTNNSFVSILSAVGLFALCSVTWYFSEKNIRLGGVKWNYVNHHLRRDYQTYKKYTNFD